MNKALFYLIVYIILFGVYYLVDKYKIPFNKIPFKMEKKLAKTKSELTKDNSNEAKADKQVKKKPGS